MLFLIFKQALDWLQMDGCLGVPILAEKHDSKYPIGSVKRFPMEENRIRIITQTVKNVRKPVFLSTIKNMFKYKVSLKLIHLQHQWSLCPIVSSILRVAALCHSPSWMCFLQPFPVLNVLDYRTHHRLLRRYFHPFPLLLQCCCPIQPLSVELPLLTLTGPILNHSHPFCKHLDPFS